LALLFRRSDLVEKCRNAEDPQQVVEILLHR
jgi:hypothetical protein